MTVSYEYIESRGSYCQFGNNEFVRMAEERREIWVGSDRSGLIISARLGSSFFTDEQRTRWETTPHPPAADDLTPTMDLFAPGCLSGLAAKFANLPTDTGELAAALQQQRRLSIRAIGELMGETLVPDRLRQPLYQLAAALPGAETMTSARDELDRTGPGVARVERAHREELIFDPHNHELIARRQILIDPTANYAPLNAVVGWTCYLSRQLVNALPAGTPPTPGPPCAPPGSGRGTVIDRSLSLSTGYFTELPPHLEEWHANGVITDAQYQSLKHAN